MAGYCQNDPFFLQEPDMLGIYDLSSTEIVAR